MGRVNQAYTSQPSLRSKRFRLVSEHRKTDERDSRFWPREKWNESKKMKEGGGGGERRKKKRPNNLLVNYHSWWEYQMSVNKLRHDRPKWAVFKISRFVYQRFLPFFPTPSPLFYLHHSVRTVFDSRPSFFAPKLHGNACYVGYSW